MQKQITVTLKSDFEGVQIFFPGCASYRKGKPNLELYFPVHDVI